MRETRVTVRTVSIFNYRIVRKYRLIIYNFFHKPVNINIYFNYVIDICVTGTFCTSREFVKFLGKNITNNHYNNNNQTCHNVLA